MFPCSLKRYSYFPLLFIPTYRIRKSFIANESAPWPSYNTRCSIWQNQFLDNVVVNWVYLIFPYSFDSRWKLILLTFSMDRQCMTCSLLRNDLKSIWIGMYREFHYGDWFVSVRGFGYTQTKWHQTTKSKTMGKHIKLNYQIKWSNLFDGHFWYLSVFGDDLICTFQRLISTHKHNSVE